MQFEHWLVIILTVVVSEWETVLTKPTVIRKRDAIGPVGGAQNVPFFVWRMEEFPNPQLDYANCRRTGVSFVCNPDMIIKESDAVKLDFIISKIKNETVCACPKCPEANGGMTVAIAILKNMYREYLDNKHDKAETFAKGLLRKWKLGSCEDAILIFLATETQEFYVASGETATSLIEPDILKDIGLAVNDHFLSGNYYQGLESLVQSIYDRVKSIQRAPRKQDDETSQGSVGLTVGLVIGFIALVALFAMGVLFVRSKRRSYFAARKEDGAMSASSKKAKSKEVKTNIVKSPVVFPDAVYQPCSVEDPTGSYGRRRHSSDEELNFEEYSSVLNNNKQMAADIHDNGVRRELSSVEEDVEEDAAAKDVTPERKYSSGSSQENVEFELQPPQELKKYQIKNPKA